jgi:hypothetical protein
MALEKTWDAAVNYAYPDTSTVALTQKSILWCWKEALKNTILACDYAAFTVIGSSDAATAGMDGVDRWGTTFDGTKIVRAAAGTAHSWICLRNATLGIYVIIDWASANDYRCTVICSKTLPTGGTTLNRPTATDQWVAFNDGQFQTNTLQGAGKIHKSTCSDGSVILVDGVSGSGIMERTLQFHKVSGADASDLAPFVSIVEWGGVAADVLRANNNLYAAAVQGRNAANTAATAMAILQMQTSANAWNSLLTGVDATTGRRPALPWYVFGNSASNYSVRGRIADCYWGPSSTPNGDTAPAGGAIEHNFIGDCWLPFPGVTITL